MEIHADRGVCIGAGNCVLAAEDVFDQDDDGIVVVLPGAASGADARAVARAVGGCPSGALRRVET